MHLTTLLFDLDGTLRHSDPPGVATFHRLAAELGVASSPEERLAAERWVHAYWAMSDEWRQDVLASSGEQDERFWIRHARRHLRQLGAPEGEAEALAEAVFERMVDEYHPVDVVPADVLPTLAGLRSEGYRLGLVSNRDESLNGKVEALGLGGAFDFALAAGEVGWWKPDPRLLLHAARLAGADPARAAYVGDNYYADVVCARSAGMQPLLYDPMGVFPDADCPVIAAIGQLPDLLAGGQLKPRPRAAGP